MAPPLTIKNPDTLAERIRLMEEQAAQATTPDNQGKATARINGSVVECRSTATIKNGTYVLFYVDDRRTSRTNLITRLLGQ